MLDSSTAISIILGSSNSNHRHGNIAKQLKTLLSLDWEVNVSHVFREANHAADFLACKGHDCNFGTHSFDVCDQGLGQWLRHDVMGITQERLIINTS
ncbi:unnamed protein product [Linum tenue]|uniref:RNase H type-1 domain-containing protein n=1 Tax=Linum tenue TaxID=586396 RepID=A0AAV0JQX6_9ROSI|nr:unnamed protein product [Linum tenue]CAI0425186.1 unnamed protein product [Linum tenue]